MSPDNDNDKLAAAELLLADVQKQREELDRREAELKAIVALYSSRLSRGIEVSTLRLFAPRHDSEDGVNEYGGIGNAILDIFRGNGKAMRIPQVAEVLAAQKVPIRAKNYVEATRTAVRRLLKQKKLRRVGNGYYKPTINTEAQAI